MATSLLLHTRSRVARAIPPACADACRLCHCHGGGPRVGVLLRALSALYYVRIFYHTPSLLRVWRSMHFPPNVFGLHAFFPTLTMNVCNELILHVDDTTQICYFFELDKHQFRMLPGVLMQHFETREQGKMNSQSKEN